MYLLISLLSLANLLLYIIEHKFSTLLKLSFKNIKSVIQNRLYKDGQEAFFFASNIKLF